MIGNLYLMSTSAFCTPTIAICIYYTIDKIVIYNFKYKQKYVYRNADNNSLKRYGLTLI